LVLVLYNDGQRQFLAAASSLLSSSGKYVTFGPPEYGELSTNSAGWLIFTRGVQPTPSAFAPGPSKCVPKQQLTC
jgi:hypothetical protein